MIEVQVYRYHPEQDRKPWMQTYSVADEFRSRMVLDVLEHLHETDQTLVFRRSCREGVCGSDGMNINGKNGLACITPVSEALDKQARLIIRPLPGMPVIRDLVVDQSLFFRQYHSIQPWLINHDPATSIERLQSPEDRAKLDGLYECILCGCCSSQCPSWWWNPEKYVGPAGLLQAWRFIVDSRDQASNERLERLEDPFSLFRCRSIGNCVWVCPKGLNPMAAIGKNSPGIIAERLLRHAGRAAASLPVRPCRWLQLDQPSSEARWLFTAPTGGGPGICADFSQMRQRDFSATYAADGSAELVGAELAGAGCTGDRRAASCRYDSLPAVQHRLQDHSGQTPNERFRQP